MEFSGKPRVYRDGARWTAEWDNGVILTTSWTRAIQAALDPIGYTANWHRIPVIE